MSKILNIRKTESLMVEVKDGGVLDKIQGAFDCSSRSDCNKELILDCVFLDEGARVQELCDILEIEIDSDEVISMQGSGHIIFLA